VSAPSRKKVKKPAAGGRTTFKIVVEAQEMVVDYRPNWMPDCGQFEFRSPHKPPRRIPVSQTGYRSHFAPMEDVEASESPQQYARDIALEFLRSEIKGKVDRNQLPLF
jgi:hypothetical protein